MIASDFASLLVYSASGAASIGMSRLLEQFAWFQALAPNGKQLAVSNWGDESVSVLDATTLQEVAKIKVGSHPNELLYAKDGRLFVANAGANSVSVIRDNKVIETIKTSLDPKALAKPKQKQK